MRILREDNNVFELNKLPDKVDDLRFCVLDNSDPDSPDYFFMPLVFIESFNEPAVVLKIGKNVIKMPRDWCILIGDPQVGDLEVLPITSLNERGFSAFVFNPFSDFKPVFEDVEILDIYPDIKWYFPKLKVGQLLTVPLEDKPESPCAFFVREISRLSEVINVEKIW